MMRRIWWAAALVVAACSPASPAATAVPTPETKASPFLDPAAVEAMTFRRAVGLQADEAWVRAVAANPAAIVGLQTYGIPMLPEEVVELERRLARIDDALAFGNSYGAEFPDGFGGAAIDPRAGFRLVLLYTKDVDLHRQRLGGMPSPLRPEVRQAHWTIAELEEFRANVTSATNSVSGIKIYGAAIDTLANRVIVTFGAADPELGGQLLGLFGSTGWLVPSWAGPIEAVDRPVGALLITVVDESGQPSSGLPCRYTSMEASNAAEGGGDTTDAGQCRFTQVPAGRYRIDILEADELVDRLLASVEIDVVGGETRSVPITIEPR